MSKIEMLNLAAEKVKEIKLNDNVWGIKPNDPVLHNSLILAMANARRATASTKTRDEIRGGGRKPWRQKGTGRARQGSIRSVQWVGGGNYGTPVPRDYSKKQNRKERRIALKSALADKASEQAIIVLENIKVESPKTKEMMNILENLKIADKKVLLVVDAFDDNMILASRNIQNLVLILAEEINVLDVVGTDVMVVTEAALKNIEEVLK